MVTEKTNLDNDFLARIIAGIFVFIYPIGFIVWLFFILFSNSFSGDSNVTTIQLGQFNEVLLVILAGGVGSSVYAIRAYLKHLCEEADFQRRYIPWYIFRSIQGALLAFIFYLILKGGILILTINNQSGSTDLNLWSLTGFCALVGLFSKYAIEKLRQVFLITFATKEKFDEETE